MDKVSTEEVNAVTTNIGLTEQSNTCSKPCKPSSEESKDGLFVRGSDSGPEASCLPVDLLRDGARELGVELGDAQIELLQQFASLLVETNKTLNLTRITDPTEIVTGHYLDSFTCLAAGKVKRNARVIDIGTGAGFPGVPIKIARPGLGMTLLDSSAKKLKFIENAIAAMNASAAAGEPPLEVEFVHARAEEAGRDPAHREAYDVVLARALADMKVLAELCLPLVKVGGTLIAQKSEGADDEIDSARALIGQLGGRVERIARIKIPYTEITRRLVVISKIKPTGPEFPRPFSKISRTGK